VSKRERLDVLLLARDLAPSRERAQALIRAGVVRVNDAPADKPGSQYPADARIQVLENPCPWVSRGGLKLQGAIEAFGVDPMGRTALDIGASTGGFTDVLLHHGAERVIAVDVGYNQLVWKLRDDARVTVLERVNFRKLPELPEWETVHGAAPDLVVCDVSFISLSLILPVADQVMRHPGEIVTLVKPQFEVGRADVGKGGIVRDVAAREAALAGAVQLAESLGWSVQGTMESPIQGTKGNVEYLLHATTDGNT
jgi:23S rRNA (cytidine1920-2'-O)/16S rRNA (cytidine1409-2'-O)-methyltransferase